MVITDYKIAADLPKTLTIAAVSDLHDRSWEKINESLISRNPDIVAILGDLISLDLTDNCISLLSACSSIAPTVYSLGNHESGLKYGDLTAINKTGAIVLDDDSMEIDGIIIGGLSSGYRFQKDQPRKKKLFGRYSQGPKPNLDWLDTFSGLPGFKILLCHHSEYYASYIRQLDIDIILAGHAHGGQIRIMNQGLFAPNQGFFPKWTSGIHENRLVISRGLANTARWIPRFANPEELVYVTVG